MAYTVIGGDDTGAAIRALGFPHGAFGYVSTGGGASLEFIEGKTLLASPCWKVNEMTDFAEGRTSRPRGTSGRSARRHARKG